MGVCETPPLHVTFPETFPTKLGFSWATRASGTHGLPERRRTRKCLGKKRGKLNPRELRFGARRKAQEGPATANADEPKGRRAEEPKGRRAEGPKEAPRTVIGPLAVRRKTVFDWQESREPVSPGSGTAREAAPGSRGGGEASARRGRASPAFRRRGGPPGKRRCVAAGRLCIPGLHARPGWRARFGMAWWEGPSGGRRPVGGARVAARGCRDCGAC